MIGTMKPLLSGYAVEQRWRMVFPYVRGRVLDIGCGFTRLPDRLLPNQPYVGVDVVAEAIRLSQQRYPQHTFYQRDMGREPLELGDRSFDTILMMAVLEHLHRADETLRDVRHYLAPGGTLLLTTPSPWGDWAHRIGSRIRLFYPEHVVQHVKIYNRRAMCDLIIASGFDVIECRHFELGLNQLAVCRLSRPQSFTTTNTGV
jgi:SAM-dependent methyltransferase